MFRYILYLDIFSYIFGQVNIGIVIEYQHQIILARAPQSGFIPLSLFSSLWYFPEKCIIFTVWIRDKKSEILLYQQTKIVTNFLLCQDSSVSSYERFIWINFVENFTCCVQLSSGSVEETLFSGTETFYLWQKLIFVTEIYFCDRKFYPWQNLVSVTQTFFSDRNLFMWQKLFLIETCFCDRNMFLWQKIVFVTETCFCNRL